MYGDDAVVVPTTAVEMTRCDQRARPGVLPTRLRRPRRRKAAVEAVLRWRLRDSVRTPHGP